MSRTFGSETIKHNRPGFTLIEVAAAAVLMGALLLLLGQAVGWVAVARRAADRRQAALLEASNVLEQLTAMPFDTIQGDMGEKIGLSKTAADLLGKDALQVDVQLVPDEPAAKRIVVAVRYGAQREAPATSVRLVTWVYQRGAR